MEPVPWYALPKDIQVSAAPKNLQKSLIGPVGEPNELKPQVGGASTNVPSNQPTPPVSDSGNSVNTPAMGGAPDFESEGPPINYESNPINTNRPKLVF